MKILNVNIDVGDMVHLVIKFDERYHNIKSDREYLGFVTFLDSTGNISISKKRLVNPNQKEINSIRDFSNLFYNIAVANYGSMSESIFNISQIKKIKLLKK